MKALNPPDRSRPYFWFATVSDAKRDIRAGRAVEAKAGSRLPSDAAYWCYPGDPCWQQVLHEDDSGIESPAFRYDDPTEPAPLGSVLVVSRNLAFAWVPESTLLPLAMPHADDMNAVFYACDFVFLSWMMGRVDRARVVGYAITDAQRTAMARAWAYVIEQHDLHSDDDPRILAPGATLPALAEPKN